jgi:hypothetical protein
MDCRSGHAWSRSELLASPGPRHRRRRSPKADAASVLRLVKGGEHLCSSAFAANSGGPELQEAARAPPAPILDACFAASLVRSHLHEPACRSGNRSGK